MHPAGLEPAVSTGERSQAALDRATTGIGHVNLYLRELFQVVVKIHLVQRCNHLDMVMNFRIPEKTGTLLSSWTTIRFIT
jgi:hypothetical protein